MTPCSDASPGIAFHISKRNPCHLASQNTPSSPRTTATLRHTRRAHRKTPEKSLSASSRYQEYSNYNCPPTAKLYLYIFRYLYLYIYITGHLIRTMHNNPGSSLIHDLKKQPQPVTTEQINLTKRQTTNSALDSSATPYCSAAPLQLPKITIITSSYQPCYRIFNTTTKIRVILVYFHGT